jgi:cytidylate kinase
MDPHTYLEHSLSVLHARLKSPSQNRLVAPSGQLHPFVTISRETGAGATTLGQQLVLRLNQECGADLQGWVFLDKDLLTLALLHHQLPERLAEFLPEDRIAETKAVIGELVGLHPSLWQLEQKISEAILQLAHVGRVIFAGRAANLITRALPAGLHVRLVASLEARIARVAAALLCNEAAAFAHIEKTDIARRRFVRSHFDNELDDPHFFDLVINTERATPGATARLVIAALNERLTHLRSLPSVPVATFAPP